MSEAVEFGSRPTANEFRNEYPDFICPIDDDRREATVHFTSDTPESVLERAEAAATSEQAKQDRSPLKQEPLTDSERAGLDFSRDGVNTAKARYLKGLGAEYGLDPSEHVDLAEIDGVEDARPILESARRTGGTGRGGGTAQYDDTASEREDRQRRERAERQASEGCDHARDHCQSGDSEACEYLQSRCGLSEEEATTLLAEREPAGEEAADASESEPWIPSDKWGDLSGSERGAVSRAAGGYHGATEKMRASLAEFTAAFKDAQAAAKAINGLRAGVDEGPLHFSELEEANAALLDAARMAAEHCHECHASHAYHDHDVTEGDTEDLRRFVRAGSEATPVGLQDGIGPARSPAEHPDSAVADREPKPGDRDVPEPPTERGGVPPYRPSERANRQFHVDGDDLTPIMRSLNDIIETFSKWDLSAVPGDNPDDRLVARASFADRGDFGSEKRTGSISIKTNDSGSRSYQADVRLSRGGGARSREIFDDTIENGTPEEVAARIPDFVDHARESREGDSFFVPKLTPESLSLSSRNVPEYDQGQYGRRDLSNRGPTYPELTEGDRIRITTQSGEYEGEVQFRRHEDQIDIERDDATNLRVTLFGLVPQLIELTDSGAERRGAVEQIDVVTGDSGGGSEQFAAERQQSLDGSSAATEDRQFTLTGGDASDPSEQAIPAAWSEDAERQRWVAGPYRVETRQNGDTYTVRLTDGQNEHTVARGVPTTDDAYHVANEFISRLSPDKVSFHSNDSAVPEAAAAAKQAVEYSTPEGQATFS